MVDRFHSSADRRGSQSGEQRGGCRGWDALCRFSRPGDLLGDRDSMDSGHCSTCRVHSRRCAGLASAPRRSSPRARATLDALPTSSQAIRVVALIKPSRRHDRIAVPACSGRDRTVSRLGCASPSAMPSYLSWTSAWVLGVRPCVGLQRGCGALCRMTSIGSAVQARSCPCRSLAT